MTDPQAIEVTSVAGAAVTGSVVAVGLLLVRRRSASAILRGVCTASLVIVILGVPWFADFLLLRLNSTNGMNRLFIDLGAPGLLLPAVVVLAVAVVGAWRLQRAV